MCVDEQHMVLEHTSKLKSNFNEDEGGDLANESTGRTKTLFVKGAGRLGGELVLLHSWRTGAILSWEGPKGAFKNARPKTMMGGTSKQGGR